MSAPKPGSFPAFPESAYLGVAARFADLYAEHYESSKEFLYMDFLALLGTTLSGRFRVDFGDLKTQPRLYMLKIALSAWRRKSASTGFALDFIERAESLAKRRLRAKMFQKNAADPLVSWIKIIPGAGSAEGLGNAFLHFLRDENGDVKLHPRTNQPIFIGDRRIVLVYDEFRRFEKKARGEGSVLISMVNEMYDKNDYSNIVKDRPVEIDDGHLGFLSNTTEETFRHLVDAHEMLDIGFLNRFFLIGSNTRKRKARPTAPDEAVLKPILEELADMLLELPPLDRYGVAQGEIVIQLTPEADELWAHWYEQLPETATTARLDAIGMRLMGLFGFLARKREVDADVMRRVLDLLDYQRQLREIYRPTEAQNAVAQMEEKIVQQLKQRGRLSKRDLRNHTNANRYGLKVFNDALKNLKGEQEIKEPHVKQGKKTVFMFELAEPDCEGPASAA